MKPLPGGEFEFLYKDEVKKPSLFFYHKYPDQTKSVAIEITERKAMQTKLESYGVDEANINEILRFGN